MNYQQRRAQELLVLVAGMRATTPDKVRIPRTMRYRREKTMWVNLMFNIGFRTKDIMEVTGWRGLYSVASKKSIHVQYMREEGYRNDFNALLEQVH